MGNPTDPITSTLDPAAIAKAAADQATKTKEDLEAAQRAAAGFGTTLQDVMNKAFNSVSNISSNIETSFKSATKNISLSNKTLDILSSSYIAFRTATGQSTNLFAGLTNSAELFGGISQQIHTMGDDWKFLVKNLPGGNAFDFMVKNAGVAEQSQMQMVNMLSAGGNLSKMFADQGTLVGDLTTQTLKYVNSLAEVAEANGLSLASTVKYADAFNRIPGVMTENIQVGGALNINMSALNAAMKVMSGSGQGMNDVMSAMNIAYTNVGNAMGSVSNKAEKGLALFSMMSSLSKDLNLEFKETSGFLGNLAEQFKFVGDNTEAAAKIMMRFTEGLRNTGLTSSASLDIIKQMTKSTIELTVGTKAFVSARSGGPGGLQGAVQIDKLNREGKSDQVMMMVLNTLKQQFGGRIVTQAEGAQSQEAAAQFTKQKMMIQSGAFGNLVGNGPDADNKATHLLEMLAKGNVGGAAKTSKEAISQVANQGNSLQKETNTILSKVSLASERGALASQVTAINTARKDFGKGNQDLSDSLLFGMKRATEATANVDKRDITAEVGSAKYGGGDALNAQERINNKFFKMFGEGAKGVFSGGVHMVDNIKNKFNQSDNLSGNLTSQEKHIAKRTPPLGAPAPIIPDALKKEQLTRGANQQTGRSAIQAQTRNTTTAQTKIDSSITVKLEGTPELTKLINAKIIPNPNSGTTVATLNNKNEPGY